MKQVLSGNHLLVGRVIKPHGKRGLLRIMSYAESAASFIDSGTVFIRPVSGELLECRVLSVQPHKFFFLMKLEGLDTREASEAFRHAEILVPQDDLSREEGVYFWHELIGLKVYSEDGEYLGEIAHIISAKGHDIYVVKKEENEFFIPATYEVVKSIDLDQKTMIVSVSEGLLDLNAV